MMQHATIKSSSEFWRQRPPRRHEQKEKIMPIHACRAMAWAHAAHAHMNAHYAGLLCLMSWQQANNISHSVETI